MARNSTPLVNSNPISWGEAHFNISVLEGEDLDIEDIASIKWDQKLEGADVFGAGSKKRGRTVGQANSSAEIVLYWDAAKKLKKALAAQSKSGKSFGVVPFNFTLSYSPEYGDTEISTVEIIGARITTSSTDMSAGSADAITVSMPLSVLDIIEDGVSIF